MSDIVVPITVTGMPDLKTAFVDEIRGSRIAFRVFDEEGAEFQAGGSILGTIPDPLMPITNEKLAVAVQSALGDFQP